MSLYSNLRFKWRVRRSILALQSAGYVTLPFDGSNVLAFHWADPQNRILFQPSRTNTRVGQVTCYQGLASLTRVACRWSPAPPGNGRSPSEAGNTSTPWASYAL